MQTSSPATGDKASVVAQLIEVCRNHPSPEFRAHAAKMLYINGAADGLDRKAVATLNSLEAA